MNIQENNKIIAEFMEDKIKRIWYQMNMKEITSEEARQQVLDLLKACSAPAVSGSDIPKYTEKQVREVIEMARKPECWDSGSYWGHLYTEDEIIEELNKGD